MIVDRRAARMWSPARTCHREDIEVRTPAGLAFVDVTGYPEGDQDGTAVAIDVSGNIVVAGTTTSEINLGTVVDFSPDGGHDVFIARMDANGDPTWHTYFHGADDELVGRVAMDSTGAVAIAGWFTGSVSFQGTDFGPTKTTTGPTDYDVFLVKLNAQGKHAWTKQLGDGTTQFDPASSGGLDPPLGLTIDSKDNVILAGGFMGTIQPGTTPLTSAGDFDWFFAKFKADGSHLWSKSFGDAAATQIVTSVATDPTSDALLVIGTNDGTLALGPGAPLQTMGSLDVVVAKLAP